MPEERMNTIGNEKTAELDKFLQADSFLVKKTGNGT